MKIKCFIDENGSVWTFNQAEKKWNHHLPVEEDAENKVVRVFSEDSNGVVVMGTYPLFESLGALSLVMERPSLVSKQSAPLTGEWHHGNNTLVCGTIRVANIDIDTNPGNEFNGCILDWMCISLNKSVSDERGAGLHMMVE